MKELELETGDLIRYKDAVDEKTSSFYDSFFKDIGGCSPVCCWFGLGSYIGG